MRENRDKNKGKKVIDSVIEKRDSKTEILRDREKERE